VTAQTRTEVRDLLERHGLSPRKSLGQHFLADPNITAKIVATAGVTAADSVVEIGPGTGTLTAALADTGARVVAYEIDPALTPLLAEVLGGRENVDLRFEDATTVDFGSALEGNVWILVANLPYNVGTPLVLDALRHSPTIRRFVVMVQVEVAHRLVASVGGKEYGLPSVVAGIHSNARLGFTVPAQVFVPPPKVGSAVVVLERREAPPWSERAVELAAAGFGQRRKMLRRSLTSVLDDPESTLSAAGIRPEQRAEELTPTDFLRLAEVSGG
jgi:16S rRNA (adenine1518-N6/adenine1519-N6)-dimethyltransferase